MPDADASTDRLYQLPLDEFTAARNALAKETKRPTLKDLEKPNVAAWAVNQLYWHERVTYDRLITAAARLRTEHRKLLAGQASDLRETEKAHRGTIREALDKVKALLSAAGQATTQATLTSVQETLEALPVADAPGKLTRPLKPMGFEALSGVTVRPALRMVPRSAAVDGAQVTPAKAEPAKAEPAKAESAKGKSARAEAAKTARNDQRQARVLAQARQKEEEERQQRRRDAEKALKAAETAMLRAEDAVKKAEKALGDLRGQRDAAVSDYQRARLLAHE